MGQGREEGLKERNNDMQILIRSLPVSSPVRKREFFFFFLNLGIENNLIEQNVHQTIHKKV